VPHHRNALCRLARRAAMSATSLRRLAPGRPEPVAPIAGEQHQSKKNWGAPSEHPQSHFEELPLLRGLLLCAFGSLLRHFFLLRLLWLSLGRPLGSSQRVGWAIHPHTRCRLWV